MTDQYRFTDLDALVLVALGGFLGANTRYAVGIVFPGLTGTFIANVTGSFILGFIVYEAMYTSYLTHSDRLFLSTGFISSYTTYSTFAYQTVSAEPLLGLLNVGASYGFGFAGVVVGRAIALKVRGDSK